VEAEVGLTAGVVLTTSINGFSNFQFLCFRTNLLPEEGLGSKEISSRDRCAPIEVELQSRPDTIFITENELQLSLLGIISFRAEKRQQFSGVKKCCELQILRRKLCRPSFSFSGGYKR